MSARVFFGSGKFIVVLVRLMSKSSSASLPEGRARFVDSASAALRVQIAFLVTMTPSGAPGAGAIAAKLPYCPGSQ